MQKQVQHANVMPKQKAQTLDSLFASMKEQRMRTLSQQSNGPRRNGGGQTRLPWARNHVRNWRYLAPYATSALLSWSYSKTLQLRSGVICNNSTILLSNDILRHCIVSFRGLVNARLNFSYVDRWWALQCNWKKYQGSSISDNFMIYGLLL